MAAVEDGVPADADGEQLEGEIVVSETPVEAPESVADSSDLSAGSLLAAVRRLRASRGEQMFCRAAFGKLVSALSSFPSTALRAGFRRSSAM